MVSVLCLIRKSERQKGAHEAARLITILGTAAVWPLAARAQPGALPVIGYLYSGGPEASARFFAAFRKGLGGGAAAA
jgi:hypothetical protein